MCSGRDQSAHARTAAGSVILPMQRRDTKAVTLMPAIYAGTKRCAHCPVSTCGTPHTGCATYCPRAFVGHQSEGVTGAPLTAPGRLLATSPPCVSARTLHVPTSMYRTYLLHLRPLPQV